MRRADRLIKMVNFLRSRRRAVTAQRIAEEFGICTRTVYRDIQDLMDSGTPISGEAGVGYVINKDYYLPPITFDQDELEAITLGISMVRQWTDDQFSEKARNALEKIQAALPSPIRQELQQVTTYALPSNAQSRRDIPPWSISFSDVRECVRTHQKMQIEYADSDQNASERLIRPLALMFFSPVWIVAAWCEKREDFRHFRLDRIRSMKVSDQRFQADDEKGLTAYLRKEEACYGNWVG